MPVTVSPENLHVATIVAAHGVRGMVRLYVYVEDLALLHKHGVLTDSKGSEYRLRLKGMVKTQPIAEIHGMTDRNQAETLRGTKLYLPRSKLPAAGEDEFYYHDLIGLKALSPEGESLGTILSVQDYGAGDILEIRPVTGKPYLIPFTRAIVPEIHLNAGHVVVMLPDGLFSPDDPIPDDASEMDIA